MVEKTCRCGKTKKNFMVDIGPFFIEECCTAAGYNHLGEKFEPESIGLTPEEIQSINDGSLTGALEIVDEGEQPDPSEEQEETKAEKKKRKYNRGGNIKKES